MTKIFLSGPMGVGKSTLARRFGERFVRPVLDLDACIEARVGMTVGALFEAAGEAGFRAMEREVLRELLRTTPRDVVISLGGGTVVDEGSRRALLAAGLLVTLRAPVSVSIARIGADARRPLLDSADPAGALARLNEARAEAYAECHCEIDTDAQPIDAACDVLRTLVERPPILVPRGGESYRIHLGHGLLEEAARAVTGKAALVVAEKRTIAYADRVAAALVARRVRVARLTLDGGEAEKSPEGLARIWRAGLEAELGRDSSFVVVGGGAVGDVAGFAASSFRRGVELVLVPTSLLAMVDSSIGGKNGIDLGGAKNVAGTFHAPRAVFADLDTLATLDRVERIAAGAEIAKAAWIEGEEAVRALEGVAGAVREGRLEAIEAVARRAIALKARVVAIDERDLGARAMLNFGHTFGHALEAIYSHRPLRHGEAVAEGLRLAMTLSRSLGEASGEDEARMGRLLDSLGLPRVPQLVVNKHVLAAMRQDKKRRGDGIDCVVGGAPGTLRVRTVALEALAALV